MQVLNTGTGYLLKTREEDYDILKRIEEKFVKERGYVVKMPPKGSPVVACMSGGTDSIGNIAILLEEFGYEVYPFFLDRGQSNNKWEVKSRKRFEVIFKERYPDLFHDCLSITVNTPGPEYKDMLRNTKNLKDNVELRTRNTYPARNPIIFMTGMEYAYSLQSKGVFPKSVFVAEQGNDLTVHGSLTYLRQINELWCWLTRDWDWQLLSLPIEKEFDNFCGKEYYTRYLSDHDYPVEETVSCCGKDEVQCGECAVACLDRRFSFLKAGVEDKTEYQHKDNSEAEKLYEEWLKNNPEVNYLSK